MADDSTLSILIQAEDQASSALQSVGGSLDDLQSKAQGVTDAAGDTAGAMSDVGDTAADAGSSLEDAGGAAADTGTNLEDAGSSADSAGMSIGDLTSQVGDLAGGLSGLTPEMGTLTAGLGGLSGAVAGPAGIAAAIGAGAAAFIGLGEAGGQWATEVMTVKDITNMSTTDVTKWGLALEDVGGDMNQLATISYMLERRLQTQVDAENAGQTGSLALAKAMEDTGTAYKDAEGNMLDMGTILPNLLTNLTAMTDKTLAANDATVILGRGGREMLVVLQEWPDLAAAVNRQTAELDTTTEEGAKHAIEYNIAMTDMKDELIMLDQDVLPAFTTFLEALPVGFHMAGDAMHLLFREIVDGAPFLRSMVDTVSAGADILHGDFKGAVDDGKNALRDMIPGYNMAQDAIAGVNDETKDLSSSLDAQSESLKSSTQQWADYNSEIEAALSMGMTLEEAVTSVSHPGVDITGQEVNVPTYDYGGFVPGAPGAPQLAVVHGGETVTPAGQQQFGTFQNFGNINVYPQSGGMADMMAEIAKQVS